MVASLSRLDVSNIPVLNFRVEQVTSLPVSPNEGRMVQITSTSPPRLRIYLNGVWQNLDNVDVSLIGHTHSEADVTGLVSDLNNRALTTRQIITGGTTGLTGGGDLSADRTLQVAWGFTSSTSLVGNTRLDQITAPTAAVSFGGQNITNLADPTTAQQGATKNYVDSQVQLAQQGLNAKQAVRATTTVNITLSGTQTIDGVAVVAGDRVLVKNQTDATTNGIYVVNSGAWSRSTDAATGAQLQSAYVFVFDDAGSQANTGWYQTTDNPTVGTSNLTWIQFSGAGAVLAGNGLSKSGNTLTVVGTANRITVSAAGVDISVNYIGQNTITTLGTVTTGVWNGTTIAVANGGTGATTAAGARTNLGAAGYFSTTNPALTAGTYSANITHSLNRSYPMVMVYLISSGEMVEIDVKYIDVNNVQIRTDVAQSAGTLQIAVVG